MSICSYIIHCRIDFKEILCVEVEGYERNGKPHKRWMDCVSEDVARNRIKSAMRKIE